MCTGIRIICENGSILIGRTYEDEDENEDNKNKKRYKPYVDNKMRGIKMYNENNKQHIIDGINKHGIVVMAFHFPGYNHNYISPQRHSLNLKSSQVVEFLLSNSQSLEDISLLCQKMIVVNDLNDLNDEKYNLSYHWLCCDIKRGKCITIECIEGIPKIYENVYGILTNSPTFPEHLEILRDTTINSLTNQDNDERAGIQGQSSSYSYGTGMIGLPGDCTSISRFIKMYTFQKFCKKEGLHSIFHILNHFVIPKGLVYNTHTHYTVVYSKHNLFYKMGDDLVTYKI